MDLANAAKVLLSAAKSQMNSPRKFFLLALLPQFLFASPLACAFDAVVIDPGHGGNDEGTAWYHVKEKDVALAVALRLGAILREKGVQCVLTRSTDTYVSLDERADRANRQPHSLLVSIHFNGHPATDSCGFATYHFSQSPSGKAVAETMQESLGLMLSSRNRGIGSQNYAMLVRTMCAAVLVECGFLSNKAEAMRFASPEGQQQLAEALALGIMRSKSVNTDEPPECDIAKCEASEKNIEEKVRKARASAARRSKKR